MFCVLVKFSIHTEASAASTLLPFLIHYLELSVVVKRL